ncbi:hypothetical protein ENTCAN_05166 [Enterobacter cancerogenus ATCC 35316]|nr:hypothetical protein ENTCAN_05166 [Enterobacter cancerogenus ATCC 35316]
MCCQRIFGKRRHSGDLVAKSQLKTDILLSLLQAWWLKCRVSGEKIRQITAGNACGRR